MMRDVVLLLSGGIESTVSLAICKKLGWMVSVVIYVDYGQKFFARELSCVERILDFYRIPSDRLHIGKVDLRPFFTEHFFVDAFDNDSFIYSDEYFDVKEDCQTSVIPSQGFTHILPYRNPIFLLYAASLAQQMNLFNYTIIYGANYTMNKPCADESKDVIDAINSLLYRCEEDNFKELEVFSFSSTNWNGSGEGYKGAIKAGKDLGAPLHLTSSCSNFYPYNCGACPSCVRRLKAFAEINSFDPAPYYDATSLDKLAPWLSQVNDLPFKPYVVSYKETLINKIKRIVRM